MEAASDLLDTCVEMYTSQPTGLAPETVEVPAFRRAGSESRLAEG